MSSFKIKHNTPALLHETISEGIHHHSDKAMYNSASIHNIPIQPNTQLISNGDVLIFDSSENKWTYGPNSAGGGGVSSIDVDGDTGTSTINSGNVLTISGGTNATTSMSNGDLTINVDDVFLKKLVIKYLQVT